MPAQPVPSHAPAQGSSLVKILIAAVLVLVAVLLMGGYWLQQQHTQSAYMPSVDADDDDVSSNAEPTAPLELPRSVVQAQEMRKQLLSHPAVTPGAGFDKPGVQTTGKAILDAIEQAKGL